MAYFFDSSAAVVAVSRFMSANATPAEPSRANILPVALPIPPPIQEESCEYNTSGSG